MGRLLIVSNRLPVTASINHGVSIAPSSGGLATGLRGVSRGGGALWIGWPGELPRMNAARRRELEQALLEHDTVPVYLDRREQKGYYEEISNGVLWPLFHYLTDAMPLFAKDWTTYRAVNEKFARAVAERYQPGDVIWVHDYQLLLLPAMLRELLPDALIGFFLHIPFPSSEVFSVLPSRDELLRGMLGADLIGFHTPSYLRHFVTSLRRILGVDAEIDRVPWRGSGVRIGVYPMGVDAAEWSSRAEQAEVRQSVTEIRREFPEQQIIVGIDRLDYTKGILRRLLAFEHLLHTDRSLLRRVRLVQVTVPSRERIESYTSFRRRVDELVGRINGEFATANWVPIHSMHRNMSPTEISGLYRAADVMIVTPLRDGMNLVSKEFIASRTDDDGVLILSEFAGAAWELGEALDVNPYDVDRLSARIRQALEMPREERRERMRALRRHVMTYDVHQWANNFLSDLRTSRKTRSPAADVPPLLDEASLADVREARHLVLLVDYDGTIVPFAATPNLAAPDPEVIELVGKLAVSPGVTVHIVSGRLRTWLQSWFGTLGVGLHAEHGLWSLMPGSDEWSVLRDLTTEWKEAVRPLLEQFTEATRGSFIEEKTASLAWHYRNVTADFETAGDFGEHQAKELRMLLGELLSNAPLEIIAGAKVVEVRTQGINKAAIIPRVLAAAPGDAAVLAIGDDRTDEDLFSALPPSAHSVHVGGAPSRARWRVDSVDAVLEVLREIEACRSAGRALDAVHG